MYEVQVGGCARRKDYWIGRTIDTMQHQRGVLGQPDLGSFTTPDTRNKGIGYQGIGVERKIRGVAVHKHKRQEDKLVFYTTGGRPDGQSATIREERIMRNSTQLEVPG